jgi:hypothetical protein
MPAAAGKSTRPAHAVYVFARYLRDAQVERKWNKGRDSVPVCQRCGKSGHFLQVFPAPRPRIQSFFLSGLGGRQGCPETVRPKPTKRVTRKVFLPDGMPSGRLIGVCARQHRCTCTCNRW